MYIETYSKSRNIFDWSDEKNQFVNSIIIIIIIPLKIYNKITKLNSFSSDL